MPGRFAPGILVAGVVVAAMTGLGEASIPDTSGPGLQGRGRNGGVQAPRGGGRRGGSNPANTARIETRRYTLPETNEEMEYAVFVSTKVHRERPSPLVIALHGLGTPPAEFLRRGLLDAAEDDGYIVAAPMGYSLTGWYGANGAGRPLGTTSVGELSEKDVLHVLDRMKRDFRIDDRRIYLAGHSMGGAGALFLGIKHKDVWAAVASSAPAIRGNLHTPSELERAPALPIILNHGDADTSVPIEQSRRWAAKMKELKMPHEYHEIRGGTHGDTLQRGSELIFRFFAEHVRK
jgi:poly(3-hydroxybutyrate) depolymerase